MREGAKIVKREHCMFNFQCSMLEHVNAAEVDYRQQEGESKRKITHACNNFKKQRQKRDEPTYNDSNE